MNPDLIIQNAYDMEIPSEIPAGDMPGEKILVCESMIKKAKTIFPHLVRLISEAIDSSPKERAVVSVCGGSGVGKSTISSILSYMLTNSGLGSLIISGDNYPRRIPESNDNERLHIYRHGGVKALAAKNILTPDIVESLRRLQQENNDADGSFSEKYDWFVHYMDGGREALSKYLGSPAELDFDEVNDILYRFREGDDTLWLKRMGRDEASLWYDKVDVSGKMVLLLEWTHGSSEHLKYVDIPVLLNSTPAETLEYRLSRGRDGHPDSPFTTLVLNIEQNLLDSNAYKAKIIIQKNGDIIDYEEFRRLS